jgi:hypothetical protein
MSVVESVRRWWADQPAAREYSALPREERETLAREANVPEPVLDLIVRRGSRAGEELPQLLRALDVKAEAWTSLDPQVQRDMQVACSTCGETKRCRRDLKRDAAKFVYGSYCPNAALIQQLATKGSSTSQPV